MIMQNINILVLGENPKGKYTDIGADFTNMLVKDSAHFIEYSDIYLIHGFKYTHQYIIDYVRNHCINVIILTQATLYLDVEFFHALQKNVFMVLTVSDTEHYFEVIDQYLAQTMDLVLVTDFATPGMLKCMGIDTFTYWGIFSSLKFKKIFGVSKSIDISFVGLIKDKFLRASYIDYLKSNGVEVDIYGDDSSKGRISFDEKINLYNTSKINLNFSGVAEKTRFTRNLNIHKRRFQIKARVFEAALCGGFVLTEYAYGIENLFIPGQEIETFIDRDELLDKSCYYLKNDDQREKIALKGYQRAIKDFDALTAVPRLINEIDIRRRKKKNIYPVLYLDKTFLINYVTFRFFLICKFIKSGKLRCMVEEILIILKHRSIDLYQVRVYLFEEIIYKICFFKKIRDLLRG